MKQKVFMAMFIMTFCVCGMQAQSNNESEEIAEDTTPKTKPKSDNYEDIAKLLQQLNSANFKQKTTDDYKNILYPIEGKSKFARRHHMIQQLEISALGGSDNDQDFSEGTPIGNQGSRDYDNDRYEGKMNFGLNIGYSFVCIPGHIEGNQLRVNKFGFGYSLGLITSFDKQDHYGVTCDFLGKIGVEAGNGHQMGVGVDFLLGSGKSCGNFYYPIDENDSGADYYDDEDLTEPYTAWCFKYGAQLWVRSNLLKTSIGNTDVRLFARYVYSVDPHKNSTISNNTVENYWVEESWQFGLTFCYTF